MNKIRVLIVLMSLAAPSFCIYSPYYIGENSCPFGQFPACLQQLNNGAPTTSSPLSTQCLKCPVGTATNGGGGAATTTGNEWKNYGCQQCLGGYYANETGLASCSECPEGTDCQDPGASPRPCPKGFAYSLVWTEGSTYNYGGSCRPCPENTYANKVGSSQCTPCPSGFYCPDPRNDPVPCPKGTATDITGYSPGTYPYYYTYSNTRCQQCPAGFFTNSTGSTRCTICPDGFYCPDPTRALKCPVGTYRKNFPYLIKFPRTRVDIPMDSTYCVRCPQGYYANVEGSTTCIKAPKGSYSADPTTAPKIVPPGTFSNSEYGQQQPLPCPDGFYTTSNGSKSCTRCPDGSYCPDPATLPRKCPIGTFSNSTMVKVSCARCPPNTYSNTTGLTFCFSCPSSMCCFDPTSNPTPCPVTPTTTQSYYTGTGMPSTSSTW